MAPPRKRRPDDPLLRWVRIELAKAMANKQTMALARLTGVHHNWLRRLSTGEIDDPGHKILAHLAPYLGIKVELKRGRHFSKYEH